MALSIVEALRAVGVAVPDGCWAVTLDSETEPTRITFNCLLHAGTTAAKNTRIKRTLDAEQAMLVAAAVQVHKVGYRLRDRREP